MQPALQIRVVEVPQVRADERRQRYIDLIRMHLAPVLDPLLQAVRQRPIALFRPQVRSDHDQHGIGFFDIRAHGRIVANDQAPSRNDQNEPSVP